MSLVPPAPPRKSKSKRWADQVAKLLEVRFAMSAISKLAPVFDFKKISAREISVWPHDRRAELLSRNSMKVEYDIGIAVLERLKQDSDEDILVDELLDLVEQVGDTFIGDELLLDTEQMEVSGYEHLPLYDRALLESHRIFGAAITLQLVRQESIPDR